MISFRSMSLQPDETVSFVVAHFWTESASLELGLSELQRKHAVVSYNPLWWDY